MLWNQIQKCYVSYGKIAVFRNSFSLSSVATFLMTIVQMSSIVGSILYLTALLHEFVQYNQSNGKLMLSSLFFAFLLPFVSSILLSFCLYFHFLSPVLFSLIVPIQLVHTYVSAVCILIFVFFPA